MQIKLIFFWKGLYSLALKSVVTIVREHSVIFSTGLRTELEEFFYTTMGIIISSNFHCKPRYAFGWRLFLRSVSAGTEYIRD